MKSVASVLIEDGWTQRAYHNENGHCILGAIAIATNEDFLLNIDKAQWMLGEVLATLHRILGHTDVTYWNDLPGRTFDEVLRVAKELDEELGL